MPVCEIATGGPTQTHVNGRFCNEFWEGGQETRGKIYRPVKAAGLPRTVWENKRPDELSGLYRHLQVGGLRRLKTLHHSAVDVYEGVQGCTLVHDLARVLRHP